MDQMGMGTNIVMKLQGNTRYQNAVRPNSSGMLSISTIHPNLSHLMQEGKLYKVTIEEME